MLLQDGLKHENRRLVCSLWLMLYVWCKWNLYCFREQLDELKQEQDRHEQDGEQANNKILLLESQLADALKRIGQLKEQLETLEAANVCFCQLHCMIAAKPERFTGAAGSRSSRDGAVVATGVADAGCQGLCCCLDPIVARHDCLECSRRRRPVRPASKQRWRTQLCSRQSTKSLFVGRR